MTTNTVHWAVVSWYGTNELADTEFCEVLSGTDKAYLYNLCHIWAQGNLSSSTCYKVQYAGTGPADQRENDPRRNIPLSTCHQMTPRQQACVEEAKRVLAAHKDRDHSDCQEWCAAK